MQFTGEALVKKSPFIEDDISPPLILTVTALTFMVDKDIFKKKSALLKHINE